MYAIERVSASGATEAAPTPGFGALSAVPGAAVPIAGALPGAMGAAAESARAELRDAVPLHPLTSTAAAANPATTSAGPDLLGAISPYLPVPRPHSRAGRVRRVGRRLDGTRGGSDPSRG
ncbi:hypothetical protein GCM10009760_24820 [Kitasatospora kazusensis]|uniref:Uncharacterized protein n=1 Tax=Kitasatospora kazusensis TaxID=407974 RepID=A0ABP5L5W0_9ACTN